MGPAGAPVAVLHSGDRTRQAAVSAVAAELELAEAEAAARGLVGDAAGKASRARADMPAESTRRKWRTKRVSSFE